MTLISIAWCGGASGNAMRFRPDLKGGTVPQRKSVGNMMEATWTDPTGGVSGLFHRARRLGVPNCLSLFA